MKETQNCTLQLRPENQYKICLCIQRRVHHSASDGKGLLMGQGIIPKTIFLIPFQFKKAHL